MPKIISNALLWLGLAGLFYSPLTQADSVTVNINGNVIASSCRVKSSNPLNVILPDIDVLKLTKDGSSPIVNFDLELEGCSAGISKVTALFSGTADSISSNYFANTGTASDVAVQIKTVPAAWATNDITPTGAKSSTVDVNAVDHTAVLKLVTRLVSPKGTPKPGSVTSVMQVSFTYQ